MTTTPLPKPIYKRGDIILSPPLAISQEDLAHGLDVMEKSFKELINLNYAVMKNLRLFSGNYAKASMGSYFAGSADTAVP